MSLYKNKQNSVSGREGALSLSQRNEWRAAEYSPAPGAPVWSVSEAKEFMEEPLLPYRAGSAQLWEQAQEVRS